MKKNIHPQIYTDCAVTCVCGNTFITSSTKKSISVEICYMCHPFYTGQQKFVDTEGRIDKFAKKMKLAEDKKKTNADVKAKKATKADVSEKKKNTPKVTLKEILQKAKEDK